MGHTYLLVSLHAWLVYRALNVDRQGALGKHFRRALHGMFMQDCQRRLLKAGLVVGYDKWMKRMEATFYDNAMQLDKVSTTTRVILMTITMKTTNLTPSPLPSPSLHTQAIAKSIPATVPEILLERVYEGKKDKAECASLLSRYLLRELACIEATPLEAVQKGHVRFTRMPGVAEEEDNDDEESDEEEQGRDSRGGAAGTSGRHAPAATAAASDGTTSSGGAPAAAAAKIVAADLHSAGGAVWSSSSSSASGTHGVAAGVAAASGQQSQAPRAAA